MAYKVCVAWMISALALTVSAAIASPISKKILPSNVVAESESSSGSEEGSELEEEGSEEEGSGEEE